MESRESDIAVFGLGIIGGIWARHLHAAGSLAACWNRTPREEFPNRAGDPVAAAERARVLILVVADPAAVESLLDRIEPALRADHLVIQSTTIDPASSARFEARVRKTGAAYLEAPFTGSKPAAESKKVVFYLGGEESAMEAAKPVLEWLSEVRLPIGSAPQAAALKLAMNLQIAAQAEALCESLAIARKAGIPDDTFFGALRKNAAWSGVTALKEPKLRNDDFSPQFSVKHMLKDIRLLLDSQQERPFPLTRQVKEALAETAEAGFADDDFIAMMTRLAEREVK